jgi:hypothetical protein
MPGTGFAHPEVEVGLLGRAGARRSYRAEPVAGGDPVSCVNGDRGEVEVRGVEAVRRADAHGPAGRAGRAREANFAAGRCDHRIADFARDVDAAVLIRGVWVVAVSVRRDDFTVERPLPFRPRGRSR